MAQEPTPFQIEAVKKLYAQGLSDEEVEARLPSIMAPPQSAEMFMPKEAQQKSWGTHAVDAVKTFGGGLMGAAKTALVDLNPVAQGLMDSYAGMRGEERESLGTNAANYGKGMANTLVDQGTKAGADFGKGNYSEAIGRAAGALPSALGLPINQTGDDIAAGNFGKAVGNIGLMAAGAKPGAVAAGVNKLSFGIPARIGNKLSAPGGSLSKLADWGTGRTPLADVVPTHLDNMPLTTKAEMAALPDAAFFDAAAQPRVPVKPQLALPPGARPMPSGIPDGSGPVPQVPGVNVPQMHNTAPILDLLPTPEGWALPKPQLALPAQAGPAALGPLGRELGLPNSPFIESPLYRSKWQAESTRLMDEGLTPIQKALTAPKSKRKTNAKSRRK